MASRMFLGLLIVGLTGCSTFNPHAKSNPFQEFSAEDIDRVSLCYESSIYGAEGRTTFDPGEQPIDSLLPAEFYLKPSGVAIRNRETISQLHKALRSSQIGTGYPKTASGILSYQVFLDRGNRILAVTSIENYQCNITIEDCSMEQGWIRFNKDMSFRGCQNEPFCRIVYEFMKKELPDKIASWEEYFKTLGGLEKHLFGGVK